MFEDFEEMELVEDVDVTEKLEYTPPCEEVADDEGYVLMWKRAEAIESYISNRLGLTERSRVKVVCLLKAELDTDYFIPSFYEFGYSHVTYSYHYEIYVNSTNREDSHTWVEDICVGLNSSNEAAFTIFSRALLRETIPFKVG